MLTPLQYVRKMQKDRRERTKKNLDSFYDYTDSLITWIIGFCITALSLIVANYAKILEDLNGSPKPIVILLLASTLLGLAYRMLAYSLLMLDRNLDDYLWGLYGDEEMVPIIPDDDVDAWKIDRVVKRLKDDFDIVATYNSDEKMQETERVRLIAHYKDWCEYYRKEYEIAITEVVEVQEVIYKTPQAVSRRQMHREMRKPSMGYNARRWMRLVTWSYWLTVLSFATAISWVSIFLLRQ